MKHTIEIPVCEHTKPSGSSISNRLWQYAKADEVEYITKVHLKRCKLKALLASGRAHDLSWQELRPSSQEEYRLGYDINGFRQTLRRRRALAFSEGLYTVTRKYTYARGLQGQFGINDYIRLNKGEVLLYSHIDELDRLHFITSDSRLVVIRGCEVDGIARIAPIED